MHSQDTEIGLQVPEGGDWGHKARKEMNLQ